MNQKTLFLILAMTCADVIGYAQKRLIDSSVFDKWTRIGFAGLTDDGRFCYVTVIDGITGKPTMYLESTDGKWKDSVAGVRSCNFQGKMNRALYQHGDTLFVRMLGGNGIDYIPSVASFQLAAKGAMPWIAYKLKNESNDLVLWNTATNKKITIGQAGYFQFSPDGSYLLVQKGPDEQKEIKKIDLKSRETITIWTGKNASDIVMSPDGSRLAFIVRDGTGGSPAVWYYQNGGKQASCLVSDLTAFVEKGARFSSLIGFSPNGNALLAEMDRENDIVKVAADEVKVDVWSYNDTRLQSQQLENIHEPGGMGAPPISFQVTIPIDDPKPVQLLGRNETSWQRGGDYMIVEHEEDYIDFAEFNWNRMGEYTHYIVSMIKDGSRWPLKLPKGADPKLSPNGRYAIYYDPATKNYYSVRLADKVVKKMTTTAQADWSYYGNDGPMASTSCAGVAGWAANDAAVFISDYDGDIWQVDPDGQTPMVNITHGYGRRHQIQFTLLQNNEIPMDAGRPMYLAAFDRRTKDNGFFRLIRGNHADPELLTMAPYSFYIPEGLSGGRAPVKAADAGMYIVSKESAAESPNFFATRDFKSFVPLTNVHTERAFNWMRESLVTWDVPGWGSSQGILYKPENFDPAKKYPVLFYYYEKFSHGLHRYLYPDYNNCDINIPYFVSNGYVVFVPDIHYKLGKPGESAVNTLVSAFHYLNQYPWFDKDHVGIQGHSFGGYETNYIVTHTNLFRAAMSSAGIANLISSYGGISGGGSSKMGWAETGQGRMVYTLWEDPQRYIDNSPIFHVDRVTTPILIMDNKGDGAVDFSEGMQFFTGLRRLGKTAWLLQYDDGGHWVIGKKATVDFDTRVTQFFNYYLKDAPAPRWMVEGLPARLKGREYRLELMPKGAAPGPNLLTPEQQQMADRLLKKAMAVTTDGR